MIDRLYYSNTTVSSRFLAIPTHGHTFEFLLEIAPAMDGIPLGLRSTWGTTMKIDAFHHVLGLAHMVTLMANDGGEQYVLGYVSAPYDGQPYAGCVFANEGDAKDEGTYVMVAGDTLAAALDKVGEVTGLPVPVVHDYTH